MKGLILRNTGVLLFLFISLSNLYGQNTDALERSLREEKLTDSKRIEVLNQLSLFLSLVNRERALEAATEAIELSKKINSKSGLANGLRNLSILYFYYDENYSQSMDYVQQALDLFMELKDSTGIANCCISLGHHYRSLAERDKEIEYHKKAFEIFTRLNDIERIGVTSLNLGESYLNNNELDKSRRLLDFSIRINDSINKLTTLSTCYKAKGNLELRLENYDKAEADFLEVIQISERLGDDFQKVTTIEALIQLASVYKLKGESEKQILYLKRAAEFSRKHGLINYLREIYSELIRYYTLKNEKISALNYISEYQSAADSVYSRQLKERSQQTNSIIQLHELEKNNRLLEEASLIQNERLRVRNLILLVVLISVSILIWLVLKISRKNRKITEVNGLLRSQQEIIENQRNHLEELNNTKDKFFSIVAHDLRSPLISLKSFSDLLIDHSQELTMDEIAEMGSQLQLNVESTIEMADNLLTWARSQMKEIAYIPEECYLSEIVSEFSQFYHAVASKKGIELIYSIDSSIIVYGDRNQLAFIIRNLVNNAIKFTNSQGIVTISAANVNHNKTEVTVSDNGIGMSEELKKTIFNIGRKLSARGTAGEKGTGLGLILCNEFVMMNNGIMEIESEPGKGTTVKLILNSHI